MPLVLAIRRVADFFCEGEIRMLKRAHDRRVHAHVERLQTIRVARWIEQAVDRLGIGARDFRESQHGAVSFCNNMRRLRRKVG